MADRATGGAGKPPLYKIVMLGDSGVGKTSLGECGLNVTNRCFRLMEELAFSFTCMRNSVAVRFSLNYLLFYSPQSLVSQTPTDL